MSAVAKLVRAGWSAPCRPWPRFVLDPAEWRAMAAALAADSSVDLLALWADPQLVHALLHDRGSGDMLPVSVPTEGGFYPALSRARPAAAWFERMIRDLFGHHAEDGRDGRPWLDHGAWALHAPLSARPVAVAGQPEPPEFAGPEGFQLPLGPVLSGIFEPAALRLTVAGEHLLRLEARLGYAHKGTLALMRGKSPRAAARFAARLVGDATVAHSIAFARAAEAASGVSAPPRAMALRAVMAELERIASHVSDLAAVADAIGFAPLAAPLARLREMLARTANAAFGHRLMMDAVLPGGVASDIFPEGAEAILAATREVEKALPEPRALFACGKNVAERLAGSGVLREKFAGALAVGGVVGRASGRAADLRRDIAEPPYDAFSFEVPTSRSGDAAARAALRLAEIGESAALLQNILADLPPGPLAVSLPPVVGEGIGWAEGARGDVWHWLRLEGGQISATFARDPGWLLWPALEAAASGIALADVPLLLASFGATVSGMDL